MVLLSVWLDKKIRRKVGGIQLFFSRAQQNVISPKWRENWCASDFGQKCPTLCNFSLGFFFFFFFCPFSSLVFSPCNVHLNSWIIYHIYKLKFFSSAFFGCCPFSSLIFLLFSQPWTISFGFFFGSSVSIIFLMDFFPTSILGSYTLFFFFKCPSIHNFFNKNIIYYFFFNIIRV